MTQPQPQPEPGENQTPPVHWKDVRFNGSLICRVNSEDPTHVQMIAKGHGQRRLVEFMTTTTAVTGC